MKKLLYILVFLFFLLLSSTIYSQIHSVKNNLDSNEKLLYYNKEWHRITDINDAMYYRVFSLDSQKITSNVRDYYRSGRLYRYFEYAYKIRNNDSESVFGGESYILDKNGDTIAKHYFPSFNWSNNLKWNDENLVKENIANTNNNYLVGVWTTLNYQGTPVKYIILYIKNQDRFYVTSENGYAFYINKTLSDNNFEMHLYAKKNKKKRDGYSYNPFSGNETYLKEVGERGYDYLGGDLNFIKNYTFVTRIEQLTTNKLGLYLENGIFTLSNGQVFDKIYPNKPFLKPGEWAGNGSGIIISKSGYIVTNNHVVKDADEIEVEFILNDEVQKFNAEIVQKDPRNDLAIIKIVDINFDGLKELSYNFKTRSSDVGTKIYTFGYPKALSGMGKEIKVTEGIISSKSGAEVNDGGMGDITKYQITAPIQGGNSGGPLFDDKGNLIGINSSSFNSDETENVNYSIKSSYVLNLIDVLPKSIELPSNTKLESLSLPEQIKEIKKYVVLIKVK